MFAYFYIKMENIKLFPYYLTLTTKKNVRYVAELNLEVPLTMYHPWLKQLK